MYDDDPENYVPPPDEGWDDAMEARHEREPDFFLPMHDLDAERYLLAAMMLHPAAIEAAAETLTPEHWFRPAHQVLFRAMAWMFAAQEAVDPVTLRDWLDRTGEMHVLGSKGALYLAELYELRPHGTAQQYARVIHGLAVRRAAVEALSGMQAAMYDRSADPVGAGRKVIEKIDRVITAAMPEKHAYTLSEFLAIEFPGGGSVIDGLLGRQERVVLVGPEGVGKTMLGHQVAYAAAAGVHPFARDAAFEPRRVLILDFENPPTILQRRMRRMERIAEQFPGWNADNLAFHAQPDGADLSNPQQAYALAQIIRRADPDLIVAGPVYKLAAGGEDGDRRLAAHLRVAQFFDEIRCRGQLPAIWLETHAPLGTAGRDRAMRPEGSNIWAKWPEFGLSLQRAPKSRGGGLDVGQFRGHRIEGRTWPAGFTRNTFGSAWPWAARWAPGTLDEVAPEDEPW